MAFATRNRTGILAAMLMAMLVTLVFAFQYAFVSTVDPALAAPPVSAPAAEADPGVVASALAYRRIANTLPLFALTLILLALTRRPLLALWLGSLLALGLYTIDHLKFETLHSHLLPADVLLLPQLLRGDLYLNYLEQGGIGLGAIIAVLGITVLFCLEPAARWIGRVPRVALLAGGLALGYATAFAGHEGSGWYDSERLGFQAWTPERSVAEAGLIASLVKLSGDTQWSMPQHDPVFVEHVLRMHAEIEPVSAAQLAVSRPDIIVWQSESFFDPSRLLAQPGATGDLPHLAGIQDRSLHGEMQVPTYGGGTVRTEFEALTGYPLRAFHGISYPYSALAQRPLMSLPRLLRDRGYRTVAIHPYEAGFWNRDRAFAHLGFDRFVDQREFDTGDYHGFYIGDDALLRHVVAALDAARAEPLFLLAISMENHGPWHERPRIDAGRLARVQVPDELTTAAATQLRHYLYHLQRGDEALGELLRFAAGRERHTVVLFYGDHLPGLDAAFDELQFRDGQPAWQQPVPFVLFDNRHGVTGPARGTLRSYHLASLVLDAAGMRETGHFRVVSADRERLGATGLASPAPDPVLDYDHALAHLSWHAYGQVVPAAAVVPAVLQPADPGNLGIVDGR